MKKISILFTAVVSVMAVSAAVAAPPKNLSWKTMQEVTFNFPAAFGRLCVETVATSYFKEVS